MTATLIVIHRYLGIAVGLLMLVWSLSGVVMMYVSYPEVDQTDRKAHLDPIDWSHCCRIDPEIHLDRVVRAQVEMLAGRPVLQLSGRPRRQLIDLDSGSAIDDISEDTARGVVRRYGTLSLPQPALLQRIDFDQWTVSGDFSRDRPLFRVSLDDTSGTVLYVSSTTGRIVQQTTGRQRFWNWLGAIPHWLYFASLRHSPALWRTVVITASIAGCFLTILGLCIGWHALLRAPERNWSLYRGLNLWHHGVGLLFGVVTLTWVLSGLLSMNPWGLLEGGDASVESAKLQHMELSVSQLRDSLTELARTAPAGVQLTASPFAGHLYWMADDRGSHQRRLDALGRSAPLDYARFEPALVALGPIDSVELMEQADNYYFGHFLPVYRVLLRDAQQTRLYIDQRCGQIIEKYDARSRGYRWWHEGLHRLDFSRVLRKRPLWDTLMLGLLSGVIGIGATGVYLAARRIFAKCQQRNAACRRRSKKLRSFRVLPKTRGT